MATHALEPALRLGLEALRLRLSNEQIGQLLAYSDLIQRWNKVYNLTAVREPDEMLTHHLLDSLAVIEPLMRLTQDRPIRLLDVGSGAGLPGVVLSIGCPQIAVDCVDAVGKKAAFLQQVAGVLKLDRFRSLHARVETITDRYEVVASRAFAALADFVTISSPALAGDGVWMAMKGVEPSEEIALLPATIEVFHVEHLAVPGLAAQRCVVWLKKRTA